MYRRHKVKSRFIKTIKFNIAIEEEKGNTTDEEVEEVFELEEPNESLVLVNKLYKEISRIRKNAKRKLEMWIKINREEINSLEDEYKTEFLLYIENKYFVK